MKILLASSEVFPYSKTGGLGDMTGAMAKFLGRAGHQVGVVTPLYRGIRERFSGITKFDWYMDLPVGKHRVQAEVWTCEPHPRVTVYFIHQPGFYDRAGLYHDDNWEYLDNPQRFIFLSKAVVHLARYLPWQPELVHVHDWQTALVPLFIRHQQTHEGWWNAPGTCLTIHNLGYQGNYPPTVYELTNLPRDYFHMNGAELYGQFSFLKGGISYADILTTVSPRYAREITTPTFGCGLDAALRARRDALKGILNGIDCEEWKTVNNPYLRNSFTARRLAGKTEEKLALQKELGLPANAQVPLFANITRLTPQKGMDILLGALEEMLAADMQFVLLGSGYRDYEEAFHHLGQRFSQKAAVRIGFNQQLSQRIEAGADFYVMPSFYEPCGLNQMYSQRYGTIPIVRATGGLDDSVVDPSNDPKKATGIKFNEYSVRALAKAIRKALVLYQNPPILRRFRVNGMKADFSWERSTEQYSEVYAAVLKARNPIST